MTLYNVYEAYIVILDHDWST